MHKSWAILLLLLLVMLLYLVDLFFHLGYIRWFIFNILSPEFFFLVFLFFYAPSYIKTLKLITLFEAKKGIKITVFYYLDKLLTSLLVIACSFVLIVSLCLLSSMMFAYALFYPKWWLVVLIPACLPELFRQHCKLNKLMGTVEI
ncbi:hypothetical protein [Legionella sp. km772]|uniref:hypothetical protein n=1 Tax=Legionella sp. km772 TaxID=2498111 RepID=UPI000F8C87CD|nr:hypothetical protein [Legionella sp. km772]RUR06516.1 hypothetical protein ELY15_13135 [Legionella sp. km772]